VKEAAGGDEGEAAAGADAATKQHGTRAAGTRVAAREGGLFPPHVAPITVRRATVPRQTSYHRLTKWMTFSPRIRISICSTHRPSVLRRRLATNEHAENVKDGEAAAAAVVEGVDEAVARKKAEQSHAPNLAATGTVLVLLPPANWSIPTISMTI
jgi:hypothetical protein